MSDSNNIKSDDKLSVDSTDSSAKISINTSKIDRLISEYSAALSSDSIEKNNTASLEVRAEKELDFDHFTKILGVEIWGEAMTLLLSKWPLLNALEYYLPANELSEIPKELALITLSTVYADIIQELSAALDTEISLTNFFPFDKNTVFDKQAEFYHGNTVPFSIKLEGDSEVDACLLLSNDAIKNFSPFINEIPKNSRISLHEVIAPLYLEFGNSYLTRSEIYSIEVGDILMVESSIDQNREQVRLRFATNQTFLAQKQDGSSSFTLIDDLGLRVLSIEPDIDKDIIPLLITFDFIKTTMSLKEIERIGLGYELTIKEGFTEALSIRLKNKTIGYGKRMKVGANTGIQITQLNY